MPSLREYDESCLEGCDKALSLQARSGTLVGRALEFMTTAYTGTSSTTTQAVLHDISNQHQPTASSDGYSMCIDTADLGCARLVTPHADIRRDNKAECERQPRRQHKTADENMPRTPPKKASAVSTLSKQPLAPGDLDVIRRIGKGGFGSVYLARIRGGGGALFAVKVLEKRNLLTKRLSNAVLRERAVARNADHPFVVTLRCAFQSLEALYLCVDYFPGGSLADILKRRARLVGLHGFRLDTVRFYAAELCSALRYLHDHRIVHRDVKPANVLLDKFGHVALGDFGISTTLHQHSPGGVPAFFMSTFNGTVAYMAPELLTLKTANQPLTNAVDWWAFGCTVYEFATGRTPFIAKTPRDLFYNILHTDPDFDALPDRKLAKLLARCLDKRHNTRIARPTNHPFFYSVNWMHLERKLIPPPDGKPALPPFVIEIQGHIQVAARNLEDPHHLSPVDLGRRMCLEENDFDTAKIDSFRNFAYSGPTNLAASPRTYQSTTIQPTLR